MSPACGPRAHAVLRIDGRGHGMPCPSGLTRGDCLADAGAPAQDCSTFLPAVGRGGRQPSLRGSAGCEIAAGRTPGSEVHGSRVRGFARSRFAALGTAGVRGLSLARHGGDRIDARPGARRVRCERGDQEMATAELLNVTGSAATMNSSRRGRRERRRRRRSPRASAASPAATARASLTTIAAT